MSRSNGHLGHRARGMTESLARSTSQMASFNPQDFGFDDPPPRPTTPPVRRGFLVVLFVLCLAALVVYGVPYVAERTGYAWEAGRARRRTRRPWRSSTRRGSSIAPPRCFAWRRPPCRRPSSTSSRSGCSRGGEGFPVCPLGGNRMTPGFQSAELGSGVIIDKAKGYIVTNNHVIKDADRDHGPAGPGRRRAGPAGRRRPQVRPGGAPGQGRLESPGRVGGFRQARSSATGCWPSAARSASTIR